MKSIHLAPIAGAIFAAAALSGAAAHATPADDAQIRTLEDKFAAGVNAKNVDAIMKVYDPSKDLIVFDVVPPRQYLGAVAYRKDWQGTLGGFAGPVVFAITDLFVATSGDMGYSHSIQHLTGTDPHGGKVDMTVRVTDIYRKRAGKWLIVHEHVSAPVDLATGKADLTSAP
jgi:ketosteroid isomerase-like protein